MIKCLECGLHWTPLGGVGGQQIPQCPVCVLRERLAAAEAERDDLKAVRDIELAHVSMSRDEEAQARIEALERELMEARRDGDTCAAASLAHAKLVGERDVQIAAERQARERAEAALGRARDLLAKWVTYGSSSPDDPFCGECDLRVSACNVAPFVCNGRESRAFLAAPALPGTEGSLVEASANAERAPSAGRPPGSRQKEGRRG